VLLQIVSIRARIRSTSAGFSGPAEPLDRDAAAWRRQLDISPRSVAIVFAGKFERRNVPWN